MSLNEFKEIFSELALIAKEKDCFLYLGDYREAKLRLSTLEIHGLPEMLSAILDSAGLRITKFRRAIVVAKDLKDYHFFETVNANRGQSSKIFQDIDEAKKWLHKG